MSQKHVIIITLSSMVIFLAVTALALVLQSPAPSAADKQSAVEQLAAERQCTWGEVKACGAGQFNRCCPKPKPKIEIE